MILMASHVPFNTPHLVGEELQAIAEALEMRLAGDGQFTKRCHAWLESRHGVPRALLTHSCTAALEMAALLLEIAPGDEIIMPSYTFSSTANAFVLRGGVPVFVDIRADTLNIDERLVEAAVTPRTKAIVPVHYAGVACEMDTIADVARRHRLAIVEDAAQGLGSTYKGRPLGSLGRFGALSFHETKNIISGEGGALLVNDPVDASPAEIIREKGTDRSRFLRGEVDKYTWQSVGSSYLPSEMVAAALWVQLGRTDEINRMRVERWNFYYEAFADLETQGQLRRPVVPDGIVHNAHIFFLVMSSPGVKNRVIERLAGEGIQATSHYVPLHSSSAGRSYGRTLGEMTVTNAVSDCLLRLPLYPGLEHGNVERIAEAVRLAVS